MALFSSALLAFMTACASHPPRSLPALEPDVAALAAFRAFDNREPQMIVSDRVAQAMVASEAGDAAERARLNDQMLALLTGESTADAKEFALRQLAQLALPESAPLIEPYVGDPHLAFFARGALENINSPEAIDVLVRCMRTLDGAQRTGAINSLGTLRAEAAVAPLAQLLRAGDADADAQRASLNALGKIGSRKAIDVLARTAQEPAEPLGVAAAEALLMWGAERITAGEPQPALEHMLALHGNAELPAALRQGALVQVMRAAPEQGFAAARAMILDTDPRRAAFAMRFVREAGKPALTPRFAALLDEAGTATQALLLAALGDRGDAAALPAIRRRATDEDAAGENLAVRAAAIHALGDLGSADDVAPLLRLAAAEGNAPAQEAAREALAVMRGAQVDSVDKALTRTLADAAASPTVQAEALRAVGARQSAGALEAIANATTAPDGGVRLAAIDTLGALGQPEAMPQLAALLASAGDARERTRLQQALIQVGKPIADETARTATVIEALHQTTDAANSTALIKVLGELRGTPACEALMAEAADTAGAEERRAAVTALGQWDGSAPAERLRAIAAEPTAEPGLRVLATQGYIRMLSLMTDREPVERVALYRGALELATRPEEKRLALSGLSAVRTREALELARTGLATPELAQEAAVAVEQIAWELRESERDAAIAALREAQAATQDEPLKTKIAGELQELGG